MAASSRPVPGVAAWKRAKRQRSLRRLLFPVVGSVIRRQAGARRACPAPPPMVEGRGVQRRRVRWWKRFASQSKSLPTTETALQQRSDTQRTGRKRGGPQIFLWFLCCMRCSGLHLSREEKDVLFPCGYRPVFQHKPPTNEVHRWKSVWVGLQKAMLCFASCIYSIYGIERVSPKE